MDIQQTTNKSMNSVLTIDLPWIFRIISIQKSSLPKGGYQFSAQLFHEKTSLTVTWINSREDERLLAGSLVTPRWTSRAISTQGQIVINRLLPVTQPCLINLFDTVPYEWVNDRALIKSARDIVGQLPDHFNRLLNGIFWDYRRFYRMLLGPSSLNGHHHQKHGNLKHTIEVTQNAMLLAKDRKMVNYDVLVMAALLHDAGKADEYQFNHARNQFEISSRGALLGHKLSIVEWIAAAIAQHQIEVPENQHLSLLHALTAVKGAPDWTGIREAVSPEAHLLSMADRLSGHDDLYRQTMPYKPGFGRYHKHLKGRPFLIS